MSFAKDFTYELSNDQRKYFGLRPVESSWNRLQLSATIVAYYDQTRIVKILNYAWGYVEYDAIIDTINREILIPTTSRGKQQKLTIPRILKIKGSGAKFSGSFRGGNIHVYDNNRNLFYIKSYPEDGDIRNFEDVDNWISNYIANVPSNYFEWLHDQLIQNRHRIKIKAGDFIAFKLTQTEYGFARILSNVFEDKKRGIVGQPSPYLVHPRSLIVAPYAFFANTRNVNIEDVVDKPTLPTICIFDIDVYRGETPIIGHKPLLEIEKQIPFPKNGVTKATINITKGDIEAVMIDAKD